MNMAVSQNSQTRQLAITLPNIVFNVARVYPFKRKEAVGKEYLSFYFVEALAYEIVE